MHPELKFVPFERKLLQLKKCYLAYSSFVRRFKGVKEFNLNLEKVGFNVASKIVPTLKK